MTGFVYAIESGDAVKIGFAKDPVRRLSELNVGAPGTHRLVGFARGSKRHEAEIHEICQAHRIRGEWFRKEGYVLLFLDRLPRHEPKPQTWRGRYETKNKSGSKLEAYLEANKLTDAEFAALIGKDRSSVTRLRTLKTKPTWDTAQRIAAATNGAVTPNDFINDDRSAKPERAA